MTPLLNKRALITGASSGIGRATAFAFAKAGYHLALVSRSVEKLTVLAAQLETFNVPVALFPMDLSVVDEVCAQIREITDHWGTVDILVNSAGMGFTGNLGDMPLTMWQAIINLNLTSPFQCIQGVLPSMRAQGQGTIINVVSIAGRQVFEQWGAYCASKYGLMALSKTLAVEERQYGIRVIALCPGAVNTPLWDSDTVHADFDRAAMLDPEDVAQSILATVQLAAHATTEELVLMPNGGTF